MQTPALAVAFRILNQPWEFIMGFLEADQTGFTHDFGYILEFGYLRTMSTPDEHLSVHTIQTTNHNHILSYFVSRLIIPHRTLITAAPGQVYHSLFIVLEVGWRGHSQVQYLMTSCCLFPETPLPPSFCLESLKLLTCSVLAEMLGAFICCGSWASRSFFVREL